MDKTTIALMIALMGGSNAATIFGVAAPARSTAEEAVTLQNSCAEQLDACIQKLMNCAEKRDHDHPEDDEVIAMTIDPQLEE